MKQIIISNILDKDFEMINEWVKKLLFTYKSQYESKVKISAKEGVRDATPWERFGEL